MGLSGCDAYETVSNSTFMNYHRLMAVGEPPVDEREQGLAERIAAEISRRVSAGELPLGSWVRQSQLAESVGTSRTPVREAIRLLSASGVVEVIPRRGARIRVPSTREIQDGYRVRAELEGLAAELAATFATQPEIDRLRSAEAVFLKAVSDDPSTDEVDMEERRRRWTSANDEFHDVILTASRNNMLPAALSWVHHQLPRNLTWSELGRDVRLMRRNAEQHTRIREAIEAGNGRAARAAITEHVLSSGELVLASLKEL